MDVVYVHRQKKSDEINWSIRSLKNIDYGNIFVIGDDPGVPGVTVIEEQKQPWSQQNKYNNQISKYLTACNTPEISETFLAMNDDFFIMGDWTPVNYNRGTLAQHIENRRIKDSYQRSLQATEIYLQSKGLSTLSFELHTPFVFEKLRLKELISSLPMGHMGNLPMQIRSIYGNSYGVETEYMPDVKNTGNPEGMTLLSTSERYFRSNLGEFIKERI